LRSDFPAAPGSLQAQKADDVGTVGVKVLSLVRRVAPDRGARSGYTLVTYVAEQRARSVLAYWLTEL